MLIVHGMEVHWLCGKETVPDDAVVSKEGHADSFLGHERIHYNWFPSKKDTTLNSASYCQRLGQNSLYLLKDSVMFNNFP